MHLCSEVSMHWWCAKLDYTEFYFHLKKSRENNFVSSEIYESFLQFSHCVLVEVQRRKFKLSYQHLFHFERKLISRKIWVTQRKIFWKKGLIRFASCVKFSATQILREINSSKIRTSKSARKFFQNTYVWMYTLI